MGCANEYASDIFQKPSMTQQIQATVQTSMKMDNYTVIMCKVSPSQIRKQLFCLTLHIHQMKFYTNIAYNNRDELIICFQNVNLDLINNQTLSLTIQYYDLAQIMNQSQILLVTDICDGNVIRHLLNCDLFKNKMTLHQIGQQVTDIDVQQLQQQNAPTLLILPLHKIIKLQKSLMNKNNIYGILKYDGYIYEILENEQLLFQVFNLSKTQLNFTASARRPDELVSFGQYSQLKNQFDEKSDDQLDSGSLSQFNITSYQIDKIAANAELNSQFVPSVQIMQNGAYINLPPRSVKK